MNENITLKSGATILPGSAIENAGTSPASNEQTKVCTGCGRTLPLSAFGGHPRTKDGHMSICQECRHRRSAKEVAKTSKSNPLARFTARELMHELKTRGYKGELEYVEVHKIRISDM